MSDDKKKITPEELDNKLHLGSKKELDELLDRMTPEDVTGKGERHNIVDWDEVVTAFSGAGWFTVKDIESFVTENYPKKKGVYYSEVLRVIRQVHKSEDYHVTKKRVKSGELKGVYYKIEEK